MFLLHTDDYVRPIHIWKWLGVAIWWRAHYLQSANIQKHYAESQYIYESGGDCNNHLPLSVIPAAHVCWSLDDVGMAWLRCYRREWKQIASRGRILPALKVARLLFELVLCVYSVRQIVILCLCLPISRFLPYL